MQTKIESYLNGELSGAALEAFEDALARDPALRVEVEQLRPFVRDLRRAGIAQKIAEAETRIGARRRRRKIIMATIFALILGSGLFWFLGKGEKNASFLPNRR